MDDTLNLGPKQRATNIDWEKMDERKLTEAEKLQEIQEKAKMMEEEAMW